MSELPEPHPQYDPGERPHQALTTVGSPLLVFLDELVGVYGWGRRPVFSATGEK